MIRSGTVNLAKSVGRITPPWLILGLLMFLLVYIYPAGKREIAAWFYEVNLRYRPDALLSGYVLDGALYWIELTLGFCVSAGLYNLSLKEWRGEPYSLRDIAAGFHHIGAFVPLAFAGAMAQEIVWFVISLRLQSLPAVSLMSVITWVGITPFLFVVPLIVDRRLPAAAALRASVDIVSRQPLKAFLLMISAAFWSMIGLILFIVGVILTLPTYQLAIARAYLDATSTTAADQE
jgi:hypothetical protein